MGAARSLPLFSLCLLGALGPGGAVSGAAECSQPAPEAARAAVEQLNRQYIDAARRGDAAWFREHMAEEVVVILGGGRRLTRRAFLELIENEPTAFRSLTVRDVTVRVFGPTVQVDADAPWELEDGSTGVSRYIDTYAWLDGRWKVVSAQITLLPPDGP